MAEDKDNDVLETTYDELTVFENFFTNHWKNIIVFGIIVVILIGVGMQVKQWLSESDAAAAGALSSAKTIEEMELALKKYPGHSSADYARLRLGTLYFESGNSQKAMEIFAPLSQKARYKDVMAQAALNHACALEQSGKKDEAAEKYATVGRTGNYPAEYRADANCSAARIYLELGKNALAKACVDLVDPIQLEGGMSNPHYQRAKLLSSML